MSHELQRGGSRKALPRAFKTKIPRPVIIGNCYYFVEAEADNYLRELAGVPPLQIDQAVEILIEGRRAQPNDQAAYPSGLSRSRGGCRLRTRRRVREALAPF